MTYTQTSNGSVYDDGGKLVGRVLTPQGVKGINGPAFYRLDQLAGNPAVSTAPKAEEAAKGIVIGRCTLEQAIR